MGIAPPPQGLRRGEPRKSAKRNKPELDTITSMHGLATLPESQTLERKHGWRGDPRVGQPRPPALHASESRKDTSGLLPLARESRVAVLPDRCRVRTKIRGIRSSSGRRRYGARHRPNRCDSNHPDRNQLADRGSSSAALHQERLLAPETIARGATQR